MKYCPVCNREVRFLNLFDTDVGVVEMCNDCVLGNELVPRNLVRRNYKEVDDKWTKIG